MDHRSGEMFHDKNKYSPQIVNVLQYIDLQFRHFQRVEKVDVQYDPLLRGMRVIRLVLVGRVVQQAFPILPVTNFGTDSYMSRWSEGVVSIAPRLRDPGGNSDTHLTREPHVVSIAVQGDATHRLLSVKPGYASREGHGFQYASGYRTQLIWKILDPMTIVKQHHRFPSGLI